MANSSTWLICLFSLLFGHGFSEFEDSNHICTQIKTLTSPPANQPYRTSFHFQPHENWMNDPNGPMIHNGVYHLFYQWNPQGAVWGSIVWGHSTSTDCINWIPHQPAIYPSQPSDINGCFSGSATILPGGKPVILYTGMNQLGQQVQNLAMPKNHSDPFLVEWVKITDNPVMEATPMNKIDSSSFRDPTTAWLGPDGRWRVLIGSKIDRLGTAILYTSNDFITWIEANQPLHSAEGTGMWECPDFFPVSTDSKDGIDTSMIGSAFKHVLKVSLADTAHDLYTIGTYDHVKDIYIPDEGSVEGDSGLKYDYGKYYASKTFFDNEKNRRILWAWVNESTNGTIDVLKGWSGLQAIPREIWLDKSGKQLIQWPVKELETLRTNKVDVPNTVLKGGTVVELSGVTDAQADVEIEFDISKVGEVELLDPSLSSNPQQLCTQNGASVRGGVGPFGLLVFASNCLEEYTAVYFRVYKLEKKLVVLMCNDLSRSSLDLDYDKTSFGAFVDIDPVHEKLSLRTLVDHSVVESFGGEGKACITARVYPTLAIGERAHLYAFNNGTESELELKVEAGDIIVAGTDGLLDNMHQTEIEELINRRLVEGIDDPQQLSLSIANLALYNSFDKYADTPFTRAARIAGHHHRGGKVDDITVIVVAIK